MYTSSKCTLEGRPLGVPAGVGVRGNFAALLVLGVAGASRQDAFSLERGQVEWRGDREMETTTIRFSSCY